MSSAPASERQDRLSQLARRARNGDRDAFELLVIATSSSVYSLACRLIGNNDDAKDVTQDVYIRAFRSIANFRGEASVSTWLYRITANCAATHLSKRHESFFDAAALDIPERRREFLPEEMADHADARKLLVCALGRLSKELRMVVVLHDVYDLTHDAIASELQISRATSKIRLHRARRRLREELIDSPLASMRAKRELDSTTTSAEATIRPSSKERLHRDEDRSRVRVG